MRVTAFLIVLTLAALLTRLPTPATAQPIFNLEPSAIPSPDVDPAGDPFVSPSPELDDPVAPLPSSTPSQTPLPSSNTVAPTTTVANPSPTPIDPADGNFTIPIDGATLGSTLNFELSFKNTLGGTPLEDFYLLVDATGSMGSAISQAKSKFLDIISNRRSVSTNVAFGVGFYRDEFDTNDGFSNSQAITTDVDDVQAAINGLRASGGGDSPEANLVALYRVATNSDIGWRPGARRILVYFGDNPGHEPTCPGSLNLDRDKVIEALNAKNIVVVAASFFPGLDESTTVFRCTGQSTAGLGQGTAITNGTGGTLVSSDDQATLISVIESGVSSLPLTYSVDSMDCDSKLSSTYVPTFPFTLKTGESRKVSQTVTFKPSACPGSFTCNILYTASGGTLGVASVQVSAISGC